MPKMAIDTDELYPFYVLSAVRAAYPRQWDVYVEVSDELLEEYSDLTAKFLKLQDTLGDLPRIREKRTQDGISR